MLSINKVLGALKPWLRDALRPERAPGPALPTDGDPDYSCDRPLLILLDVINQCNLKCVMCYLRHETARPRTQLDLETFGRFAREIFPLSDQVILSCGFEPLLLREIADYAALAARHEIPRLYLTTNAMLLDRTMSERLIDSGLPHLAVSLDGATPPTYEAIRIGARFDRLIENLKTFTQLRRERGRAAPALQFNYVLMERNLAEVPLLIECLAEFEPRKYVFIHEDYTAPTGARRARTEAVLRQALAECVRRKILFEEIPNVCLSFADILEAYGCDRAAAPRLIPVCADPWRMMRLLPNGDVWMCPFIEEPAGNIHQSSPLAIWHGSAFCTLRTQLRQGNPPTVCRACPYAGTGLVQLRRARDRVESLILHRLAER